MTFKACFFKIYQKKKIFLEDINKLFLNFLKLFLVKNKNNIWKQWMLLFWKIFFETFHEKSFCIIDLEFDKIIFYLKIDKIILNVWLNCNYLPRDIWQIPLNPSHFRNDIPHPPRFISAWQLTPQLWSGY